MKSWQAKARQMWATVAPRLAAFAVLLALAVLSYHLVMAPFHGVHDATACARAYAAARTHADTVSADFLSYPDPAGRQVDRRCGAIRAASAKF